MQKKSKRISFIPILEPLVPPQEGKVDFTPSASNIEDDEEGDDSGSVSSMDDNDGRARTSKIRTLRSQV